MADTEQNPIMSPSLVMFPLPKRPKQHEPHWAETVIEKDNFCGVCDIGPATSRAADSTKGLPSRGVTVCLTRVFAIIVSLVSADESVPLLAV